MTLEKLLIFGFALAALFAITTVGVTNRSSPVSGSRDSASRAKPNTVTC